MKFFSKSHVSGRSRSDRVSLLPFPRSVQAGSRCDTTCKGRVRSWPAKNRPLARRAKPAGRERCRLVPSTQLNPFGKIVKQNKFRQMHGHMSTRLHTHYSQATHIASGFNKSVLFFSFFVFFLPSHLISLALLFSLPL